MFKKKKWLREINQRRLKLAETKAWEKEICFQQAGRFQLRMETVKHSLPRYQRWVTGVAATRRLKKGQPARSIRRGPGL